MNEPYPTVKQSTYARNFQWDAQAIAKEQRGDGERGKYSTNSKYTANNAHSVHAMQNMGLAQMASEYVALKRRHSALWASRCGKQQYTLCTGEYKSTSAQAQRVADLVER